jgi:hypothetical protein
MAGKGMECTVHVLQVCLGLTFCRGAVASWVLEAAAVVKECKAQYRSLLWFLYLAKRMATAAVQQPASVGPSPQPLSEEVGACWL